MVFVHQPTKKHPASLKIFFATEMWERYGFYVVQALLALYLALYFKWTDEKVYTLVGLFTALTYLSPMVGGFIADTLLGQKKSIFLGTVFLFFSYFLLFLSQSETVLIPALSGIIMGTGLLKPNISSLLGTSYDKDDEKREDGFTIFYMGITTGILLGTTLPHLLNVYFGWSIAFLSAAFGILLASFIFFWGSRRYQISDYPNEKKVRYKYSKALLTLGSLWLLSFYILSHENFANFLFLLIILACIGYLLSSIRNESKQQIKQTLAIALLCLISIMFWAFYFQMFLSLTLLISRLVAPNLLGFSFPPPYYVSIESLGMLFFGYLFTRFKRGKKQAYSGKSTANKFFLSMLFMIFAYGLITLACHRPMDPITLLSPFYFILAYLMISIAELLISPVGLAAITMLANPNRISTMVGIFFVSLGIGGFASGKLAKITAIPDLALSSLELKNHYATAFTNLVLILIFATLLAYLLTGLIKSLLSER